MSAADGDGLHGGHVAAELLADHFDGVGPDRVVDLVERPVVDGVVGVL